MKKSLLILGTLSAILSAPLHAAIVYSTDFGAVTDITGNFNVNGATDYAWNSTAGVGGGAGLAGAGTNAASYIYNGSSFDLSAGAITFSVDFTVNYSNGNNRAVGQLGVVGDSALQFTSVADMYFVSTRLSTVSGTNDTWQLQVNSKSLLPLNSGITTSPIGSNFTLTNGEWYRHELTINRSATADQFLLSGSLTSLGASGTTVGSVIASYSDVSVTNALVYADSSVFGGFRSRGTEGPKLDNFSISVVPEPSTYAAMLGLAAVALALLRRRR